MLGDGFGIVRFQVLLVEPAELGRIQARGLALTRRPGRTATAFRRSRTLPGRRATNPGAPGNSAAHAAVAGIAVLHDVGRAGAFGTVWRPARPGSSAVGEMRHRRAQRLVDADLARGVVDVVVAAHHVADACRCRRRRRRSCRWRNRRCGRSLVVRRQVAISMRPLDLVVPGHHAIQRILGSG